MPEPLPVITPRGSYLCTVSFYRMPDGSVRAELADMPTPVIEARDTIADRFLALAGWCEGAARSFEVQSTQFEEAQDGE